MVKKQSRRGYEDSRLGLSAANVVVLWCASFLASGGVPPDPSTSSALRFPLLRLGVIGSTTGEDSGVGPVTDNEGGIKRVDGGLLEDDPTGGVRNLSVFSLREEPRVFEMFFAW